MAAQYISITGLRLRKWWYWPLFWRHALASMVQARRSNGNISVQARQIDGVHHTLTVWRDRKAMLAFVHSASHANAIAVFGRIASGKTYGYSGESVPNWADIPAIWREKGREYLPR